MKASSSRSVSPPAREIRCHFVASTGLAGAPWPVDEDAGEAVLRDGAAVQRRLAEDRGGGFLVAVDAVAVIERDGIFDLGVDIVGERRLRPELTASCMSLRHAAAFFVKRAERILRIGAAGLGRDAQQFGGAAEIPRQQLALHIEQRQIVSGHRLAELGGGGEQFGAGVAVARAAAAGDANIASANIALASPRSAASLYHSAALSSSCGTPKPLA